MKGRTCSLINAEQVAYVASSWVCKSTGPSSCAWSPKTQCVLSRDAIPWISWHYPTGSRWHPNLEASKFVEDPWNCVTSTSPLQLQRCSALEPSVLRSCGASHGTLVNWCFQGWDSSIPGIEVALSLWPAWQLLISPNLWIKSEVSKWAWPAGIWKISFQWLSMPPKCFRFLWVLRPGTTWLHMLHSAIQ